MLRYLTAGESHGKCMVAILEGIPAGLKVDSGFIDSELSRRQKGYGRGKRMEIESDRIQILSGIRFGKTIGSPISLVIENRDWEKNREIMSVEETGIDKNWYLLKPRPGHADLSGGLKFDFDDLRNVSERASARETSARVAVGAICRSFLSEFGIRIFSAVEQIGTLKVKVDLSGIEKNYLKIENSSVRCADSKIEKKIIAVIDRARASGDTVGGRFAVVVKGVPAGLGNYIQWDKKLDGRLAHAVMSIQAVKCVEIGCGFEFAGLYGSDVHDEIRYDSKNKHFYHDTNNSGGIEGGVTNGEDIVIHAVMKPIPTLGKPLASIDISTKKTTLADIVRSDVCAVPACSVIAESAVGYEIAYSLIEKFGGDSIPEIKRNFNSYLKQLKEY